VVLHSRREVREIYVVCGYGEDEKVAPQRRTVRRVTEVLQANEGTAPYDSAWYLVLVVCDEERLAAGSARSASAILAQCRQPISLPTSSIQRLAYHLMAMTHLPDIGVKTGTRKLVAGL